MMRKASWIAMGLGIGAAMAAITGPPEWPPQPAPARDLPINPHAGIALARRFAIAGTDRRWAPPAQRRPDAAFARVPFLPRQVAVRCATTVCRVDGRLPADGRTRRVAATAITRDAVMAAIRTRLFRYATVPFGSAAPAGRFVMWSARA